MLEGLRNRVLVACAGLMLGAGLPAVAQEATKPADAAKATEAPADVSKMPFMDTSLEPVERARDLVQRMTLEEKASQLVNQARAIPRLNVPGYDWWSESLHGVAVNGTTEFPEPIGLAATFDPAAIHAMAVAISTEGRIKHVQAMKANGGSSNVFQGLDFWAPISISFAIRDGDAGRKPTAKTRISRGGWAWRL
jgi:beta-glucosidase-like glycosyl hydrolase